MEVANTPESRPEDVLHEMAAGSEEIGARLLRMAGAAAAVHRASALDLLLDDDAPVAAETPVDPQADLSSEHDPARVTEEREQSSSRGYGVHVAAAIRRTEAAR